MNAQLRYFFHLDPEALTYDEWLARYEELVWIKQQEAKANKVRRR